ncbi:DUF4365 domain-containing protein [Streptomyces sp. NPDC097619]|uniref:DUF4365 domain-containing protein n=1 Tax=Streptomyces sp. NPDC097619 TaxID=3157228 RepID=UPI00331CD813
MGRIEAVNDDTFTACMEQLQEGYVAAVAATAGCAMESVRRDIYGMDALLVRPPEHVGKQEVSVFAQLKNTTTLRPDPEKSTFGYQLKKREYFDRLALKRKDPKAILIVMATSVRQADWTTAHHDRLEVSHCCYWVSLEGQTAKEGVESPTVKIPTANIFDANALTNILDKLDRGESLNECS